MQYGTCYMHRCTHQITHTDARNTYHTAYTSVSLMMNPRGSKYVGDIQKLNINL
jgi:hypothetical protein